jgi:hypothetical protein
MKEATLKAFIVALTMANQAVALRRLLMRSGRDTTP